MKKQVVRIHGGETFETYEDYIDFLQTYDLKELPLSGKKKWKNELQVKLGGEYQVIQPTMPCAWNAKYSEWKIWFEKHIPLLNDNLILLGNSLGGIFVAKYLSENDFPKKIKATYLIAAPFDESVYSYTLSDFKIEGNLDKFARQGGKIFLFHSKDDPYVPFEDFENYSKALPEATRVVFEDRGHFIQEEFPELVESIKGLK